jgi:hypothetical protein
MNKTIITKEINKFEDLISVELSLAKLNTGYEGKF